MISYGVARFRFDAVVGLARQKNMLVDDEPFADSVQLRLTPYRVGQLAIDDIGTGSEPDYRLVFAVTVDAYTGPPRVHPAPIDLSNDDSVEAFRRIQQLAAE
jgi:hypothetical protein